MEVGIKARQNGDRKDVKATGCIVKTVAGNVGLGRTDDALLLMKTDGVFRRFGVAPRFNLDEYKDVTVPCDDIDFAVFGPIAGSHDAIVHRAEIGDGQDFRSAAEWEPAVEQKRERHICKPRSGTVKQSR